MTQKSNSNWELRTILFYFVGQIIYPGKVTDADTFRIGNIGHLFPADMKHLIECVKEVLEQMKVDLPVHY